MFIPIGDDNSRRSGMPYVVWLLIATNLACWYLQLTLGEIFTYAYAATPREITSGIDINHIIHSPNS